MAMNVAVICFSGIAYGVRKIIILKKGSLEENEKANRVSETKELVFRNLSFCMYVSYLSTCSKTAIVLPPACGKLCRDDTELQCFKYLNADYSVPREGQKYHHYLLVSYISTAYIFALPAAALIALWKARLGKKDPGTPQDVGSDKEMISALQFLFENYKTHSWYWEFVEMTREVILTSGLILIGQETRSYIGLALVIAGMYGIVFAWVKPLQDVMENRVMTTSLAVTVVNLVIGVLSKIPAENITGWIGPQTDDLIFKILVFAANSLVIGLVVGKITLAIII